MQTKVAEAKAEFAERRLEIFTRFGYILLAIFGIGIPLITSLSLKDDVQGATERMERRVQAAIGKLSFKPDLSLYFDDEWVVLRDSRSHPL